MQREPSRLVTAHEFVTVKCPDDWGDQYLLACAIRDDVKVFYDAGVQTCEAFALNHPDEFSRHLFFDGETALAAAGGQFSFIFVAVWFVTSMFDVALLDPLVAKYELVVARKYRFDHPSGGGERLP